MTNDYQRETAEFAAVQIFQRVNGGDPQPLPLTAAVELAILPSGQRPTSFPDRVDLNGQMGVWVRGLPRGTYRVWYRVTDTPEIPVDKVPGEIIVE